MLSHERIWSALDALAERHGLTASGLARRAGLDPTAFNKSKRQGTDGRDRWPSTESISKVLQATGATLDEFMGLVRDEPLPDGMAFPYGVSSPRPVPIPLLGFAKADSEVHFDNEGFPKGRDWDVVEFPANPSASPGVYALEVQGDGMSPLYRDGDVLIVDPRAEPRRGDRVIVLTRKGELLAKVLKRRTARLVELEAFNSEHATRSLDAGEIDWIARIIWASQ